MNPFEASKVDQPSDFQQSDLRDLDQSLRCSICGDLFDAPVNVACGHAFCSMCLRSAMTVKQECPSCRKGITENQIRPIPVLEDIITAWKASRPLVLQLTSNASSTTRKTPNKKRKRSPDSETPEPSRGSGERSSPKKLSQNDGVGEQSSDVPCPVCNKFVRMDVVNRHLDSGCEYMGTGQACSKQAWSKLMAPGKAKGKEKEGELDKPIPKVSYDTLKDKQIKDLLAQHNLSTVGDRATLQARYTKWRTLVNANLDKGVKYRSSERQLRRELQGWEEQSKSKKDHSVKDPVAHEKEHKDEFKRLVALAKQSTRSGSSEADAIEVG